jgi:cation diffusion facilitator family transporter
MKAAKLHNSQALKADAIHFSTDIWSSAVVLMGLICAEFGIFVADSIAALLVAFIVMFVSYRLGKDAINVLLDRVPEEMEKIIISYLDTFSDIKHYHNLKVRSGGADTFIEVTIHLDSALSLVEAHDITTAIEENLMKIIKRGEVIVHAEPDEDH